MNGVVGVHVLDVALGHQPERFRAAGRAVVAEGRDGGGLPRGAGLAAEAALLDDVQQAVGVLGGDAPAGQAVAGQRQSRRRTSSAAGASPTPGQ